MKSLFIHLRLVRDIFLQSIFSLVHNSHFEDSFLRLSIVFNFRKCFYFNFRSYFSSYFFNVKDLYDELMFSFYSIILIPISESFSSKSLFLFRPFRNSYNFFSNIKKNLLINFSLNNWFLNVNVNFFFTKSILENFFFINRCFALNLLKTNFLFLYKFKNFYKFLSYSLNVYYYFFIYLFLGLVYEITYFIIFFLASLFLYFN